MLTEPYKNLIFLSLLSYNEIWDLKNYDKYTKAIVCHSRYQIFLTIYIYPLF